MEQCSHTWPTFDCLLVKGEGKMLQNSVATFCNGDPKIIRITKIPYILHLALEHLFPLHPKVLRHIFPAFSIFPPVSPWGRKSWQTGTNWDEPSERLVSPIQKKQSTESIVTSTDCKRVATQHPAAILTLRTVPQHKVVVRAVAGQLVASRHQGPSNCEPAMEIHTIVKTTIPGIFDLEREQGQQGPTG